MSKMTTKPIKKPFSFLIYIAGDNNLSDAGLKDIQELCQEGASPKVYVGVEIDTYGEHTGSIRYEITEPDFEGKAHRVVIERLSEKNSGSPQTLKSFLNWGIKRFPADNYILVIWNHGSGFQNLRKNIAYDDFGTSLSMPEITSTLKRCGINKKNSLSIIGFDACLMNLLEVAAHFNGYSEMIVGSQQTEPGDGWPYDKVLSVIKKAKSSSEIAKGIVNQYISDYKIKFIPNVTQSVLYTEKARSALKALFTLGDLLAADLFMNITQIRKLRVACQNFEMADYIDCIHFGNLVQRYIKSDKIKNAAKEFVNKSKQAVLYSKYYGNSVKYANGASIWFPTSKRGYFKYRSQYIGLRVIGEKSGWVKFLDKYFSI